MKWLRHWIKKNYALYPILHLIFYAVSMISKKKKITTNQSNLLGRFFPGSTTCRLMQQFAVQAKKKKKHENVLFTENLERPIPTLSNTDALNNLWRAARNIHDNLDSQGMQWGDQPTTGQDPLLNVPSANRKRSSDELPRNPLPVSCTSCRPINGSFLQMITRVLLQSLSSSSGPIDQ